MVNSLENKLSIKKYRRSSTHFIFEESEKFLKIIKLKYINKINKLIYYNLLYLQSY